jgi:hypothetical protein
MPASPRIRIPSLEILSDQLGGSLGRPGVPLTSQEIGLARPVFGESIVYGDVRVVVTTIVAAPTTLGNNIRTAQRDMEHWVLIHELTHVWQYQTQGTRYISDSACAQLRAAIAAGDRNAAYSYTPGQRHITDYSAEQQASIVEDWFKRPALRTDANYMRYISQVRSARPTMTAQERYNEAMFGDTGRGGGRSLPPPPSGLEPSGTSPLFRVEW